MFIIRDIFTAKPGQASKLAKTFKTVFANEPNARVLTDYVSGFNTVIFETEFADLAEFEKRLEEYSSGSLKDKLSPEAKEAMSKYTELHYSGRREIFRVVE